jgi:hypothetical protein
MEFDYKELAVLHEDNFANGFDNWHHEGVGEIKPAPQLNGAAGMRLHCHGSRQGGRACMAFFRPNLPDRVAFEYDLTIRSHGGLVINYLGIRGLNGEDLITDADKLRPREGIMANYYSTHWGLQSYHVSVSRFNDKGEHTGTCNFRRNPGCKLVAHGQDHVTDIDRPYHIKVIKDGGHCALYVDGICRLGFVDSDASQFPIPDTGKFGFRLIGSDVMADVHNFRVIQLEELPRVFGNQAHYVPEGYEDKG